MGAVEALSNRQVYVSNLYRRVVKCATVAPLDRLPHNKIRTARQLRPAEIAELIAKFQGGASIRELAVEFGIYRVTVGQHLRSRGIDTRNFALKPDDAAAAAKLYEAGWTIDQLAERYNVGNETVRGRLVSAGVKLRSRGRTPKIS